MDPGSIPEIRDKWPRKRRGTVPQAGKKPDILPRKTGVPGRRREET